jgi:fermentation-respiration switch protein FrsA (DUF1100 family)
LAAIAIVCGTIWLAVVFFEKSMIFFPTRYPDGFWDVEEISAVSGASVEDHFFSTDDHLRLHGWWCRPDRRGGTADIVLLWFHGNAGNLSHRVDLLLRLAALPAQVFLIDYRGYGRSEGRPDEHGLYRDGAAAWRYLVEDRAVTPDRIVIFGKSLGGAVAVDLAATVVPAGLILESTFTSVPDMAAHHFPIVPRALVRTRMDSLSKIRAVGVNKLHIHSPADEVVPYTLGRRLYDAAPEPKRFHEVAGAGHNETYLVGGAVYFETIRRFLEDVSVR